MGVADCTILESVCLLDVCCFGVRFLFCVASRSFIIGLIYIILYIYIYLCVKQGKGEHLFDPSAAPKSSCVVDNFSISGDNYHFSMSELYEF